MKFAQTILNPAAKWAWKHKLRLAALLAAFAITAPTALHAQLPSPCCALLQIGLQTINTTIKNVVGGGLNKILGVDQQIQQFEQSVIFPLSQIQQAIGTVKGLQGGAGQIRSISQVNIASATLPVSQQLEGVLLSRNPNQIGQTGSNYTALYGAVPSPTDASPAIRNVVDMNDAVAQAAMKRSIEIDALADKEIQAADQIDQGIRTAAAGSVPILEAQASAWVLRSQAYTQTAVAELMRVRSISLANSSVDVKTGANSSTALRQALQNLLQHQ